jgi:hypothetical protein
MFFFSPLYVYEALLVTYNTWIDDDIYSLILGIVATFSRKRKKNRDFHVKVICGNRALHRK